MSQLILTFNTVNEKRSCPEYNYHFAEILRGSELWKQIILVLEPPLPRLTQYYSPLHPSTSLAFSLVTDFYKTNLSYHFDCLSSENQVSYLYLFYIDG